MKFMLDTDICIYLIRQKPVSVIARVQEAGIFNICISSITLSELEYGVEKSQKRDQNKVALTEFIAPLDVMAYDDLAAVEYGRIRASLEARGKVMGPMDMLIAAHALSLGLTLITNNEKEFKWVPSLRVENWAK